MYAKYLNTFILSFHSICIWYGFYHAHN